MTRNSEPETRRTGSCGDECHSCARRAACAEFALEVGLPAEENEAQVRDDARALRCR